MFFVIKNSLAYKVKGFQRHYDCQKNRFRKIDQVYLTEMRSKGRWLKDTVEEQCRRGTNVKEYEIVCQRCLEDIQMHHPAQCS